MKAPLARCLRASKGLGKEGSRYGVSIRNKSGHTS